MHCGCISLGNVKCDECQRNIPYPERYLLIDEPDNNQYLCVDCCQKRGLVKQRKGERGITFFVDEA